MKAPKQPYKPYPPTKPLAPVKEVRRFISFCEIELKNYQELSYEDFMSLFTLHGKTPKDVTVVIQCQSHYDYDEAIAEGKINLGSYQLAPNPNYKYEKERFDESMKYYEKQRAQFDADMKKYREDYKEYEKAFSAWKKHCEELEIKKLKKRLKQLEGK